MSRRISIFFFADFAPRDIGNFAGIPAKLALGPFLSKSSDGCGKYLLEIPGYSDNRVINT
jgi:hypothetical protein